MSYLHSTDPKVRAKGLLAHYMRTVWRRAGLNWNEDNEVEVEEIVNEIIVAAVDAATDKIHEIVDDRLREHAESAPHLYPDGSS